MLVGKIHDDLSRKYNLALAQATLYLLFGNIIVRADYADDVIYGKSLIVDLHGSRNDALNELHVDVAIVRYAVCHERVDDALNLAHAAVSVLGNVGDDVLWNMETVTLNLSL